MTGYVRVTSDRWDSPVKPDADEMVVRVDRSDALLGNPEYLRAQTAAERTRVIALNQQRLDADLAVRGPLYQRLRGLADRVLAGERICLHCHCAPRPCHGDAYRIVIERMVRGEL